MARIRQIQKRGGQVVDFDLTKIADAIARAFEAAGQEDRFLAEQLAEAVRFHIERTFDDSVPGIEDIQDIVEKVLIETNHAAVAKSYILYRERRTRKRRATRVRKKVAGKRVTTDLALMVDAAGHEEMLDWDKGTIVDALITEAQVDRATARKVAAAVERKIFDTGLTRISTGLIRELVDNELFERGLTAKLAQQATLGMPKYDLEQLIFAKSKENSNITVNNPEAINLTIAEHTLKQYALEEIFSPEVSDAHKRGAIHLHDLGYPTRVYCSSHSLEYLKKYGLKLQNLDTSSAPAKHARTLTGHLNTFLASMQAYYAGALGVGYINILYAPYLEGMSDETMRQEAQHLIFSGSQSAFSRGGQTLFLDFNIHTGVPNYMKGIPAIGPGGKYTGKTYGDYEELARKFAKAMLDVWRAGDKDGKIFAFPKCDFHVSKETFADPKQMELLEHACLVASENGTPYFVFDHDEVTLAACCRLRTTIEDDYMLKHPESQRFCGFQNVTINLPQAGYHAGPDNIDGLLERIDDMMDLVVKAHLEKKEFIEKLMSEPQMPMWQVGRTACDGRPYIDLEKATYIIGMVGLNECLQHVVGKELHEDDETLKIGLRVISHMYLRAKKYQAKYGLKFTLEESPAESATRRMAKIDMRDFPEAARAVVKGDIEADEYYYTNSIHLRADAPVDMLTRIIKQAKFHSLIESGAIIHAFVGEERPSPASIMALVERTLRNTKAAQLTISPEFTVCTECGKTTPRLVEQCGFCGSENVYGVTRIVGYFSRITNWNKSKVGELRDRHQGNYSVQAAMDGKRMAGAAAGQ